MRHLGNVHGQRHVEDVARSLPIGRPRDAEEGGGRGRQEPAVRRSIAAQIDGLVLAVPALHRQPSHHRVPCRVVEADQWCRRCGCEGTVRDTVVRRLAHEPLGWRPTILEVIVRRYRCGGCAHVWRQDTSAAAEPRARLSRRGLRWALEGIVVQHLTVARVAEGLGVAWNTANDAVLA